MAHIILGQLTFWREYGISQCFFLDFTDCHIILFFSDCGLMIRGPTAVGARAGTVFNSNLCDRIIDIGNGSQTVTACYELFFRLVRFTLDQNSPTKIARPGTAF